MTFTVGWEEWVALPGLGIPAIRAKIDTGAQTSALHAFSVHRFEDKGRERVRFGLHPLPERPDIELYGEADLVGQREITSSNGETELRFVISAKVRIGTREWPIEISLANRETMNYRMLLGRRALEEGVLVDVTRACVNGTPDLSVYDRMRHVRAADRPLAIGLLTDAPDSLAVERLKEAAEARSHGLTTLDVDRCYVSLGAEGPALHMDGKTLPRFDAVLPQFVPDSGGYALAVLRHLESSGMRSLNPSVALAAAADKLHALQLLSRRGIMLPFSGFANAPRSNAHLIKLVGGPPVILKLLERGEARGTVVADTRKVADSVMSAVRGFDAHVMVQQFVAEAGAPVLRGLVVGRKLVACLKLSRSRRRESATGRRVRPTKEERRLALRAAAALNLQVAVVDLVRTDDGPLVVDVDPAGAIERFERFAGVDAAGAIIAHLERRIGRAGVQP